ncbi:TolC family protein [Flavobacterium sp. WLB]|uniref:TolC family protein n=1 Tax=unclassified Flavobacterium TaxID=196869 RepID=UPI0006ABB37D|nr:MULTISPECIES: TolC family protein [unclassified Flavobacterium]KOP38824.1 transporter [Flavobacterium sp. VMW]OWU92764.1 transporter [Flavobacterium sp. NLM]PUU71951.1 TolC family protein [Flavobacterium sp. WLB]
MKIKLTFAILCLGYLGYAQNKLETYIQTGLKNNEVIRQHNFDINKSMYALKEARALFYPTVSLNGSYTKAEGGRTIDIPIGDMLNPVYSTLNQITNSNAFPMLENQSVLINPDNFYDAKIHTTMPLLNFEIIYNKRIKTQQTTLQKIELEIYQRELVKEIKIAYYKYLQSVEGIKIYEDALALVKENQRVNQALFKNEKINRTAVLRSENEVIRIQANLETARQTSNNARSYFNFLLNQKLDTAIETDQSEAPPIEVLSENTQNREELQKLTQAKEINENVSKLNKSYWLPKVSGFADFGIQDFDFEADKNSRYYFAGVALEWNIFSGNKNKWKLKQVEEDSKKIISQTDNVKQQLLLQFQVSQNNLKSALEQFNADKNQKQSAKKYNDDITKLYKEGQAIYIELLDAQNQWVNAQLNTNISLYNSWIAFAELERANATFTFN